MITLNEWLELVGYIITEGCDYMWNCYGDAYILVSENYNTDIVFCKETLDVREVTITHNNRTYRLIDKKFAGAMYDEATLRGIDVDSEYIDLETVEDFREKANAIVQGIEYDERIMIPLDMTDAEMLMLMRAAHALDITFNQFVELAVTEALKSHEK
jgi:hypothetical protein